MITMLLMQGDLPIPSLVQYGAAGLLGLLFIAILLFLLKALPSWKEVRLAEIDVRKKEADANTAQAISFGQLSDALKTMSDVLNNVAIEQKHATDKVQILQRVNADAVQQNGEVNASNGEKIDQIIGMVENLGSRIAAVEKAVSQK